MNGEADTEGARGKLHRSVAKEIRCHVPISGGQRVGNLCAEECVDDFELVWMEIRT